MAKTDLGALLALQELDLRLRDLDMRLKLLPQEMKDLIARRDALLASTAEAKNRVNQVELAIKNTESSITALEEENRKLQQQSGMVKKNTEYQALLAAIAANKEKAGSLEEKLLQLFDDLEEEKKRAARVREDNDNSIKNAKVEFDELYAFSKTVEQEIARLKAERPKKLFGIDPDTMSRYVRLLNAKTVRTPVSLASGGVCGNCHLRLTPQCISDLRRESLAVCDNCQGLIYTDGNPE